VSVTSPFSVDLLEHGELVGTSGTTKVMLPAGRHDIVLRNASIGYESRHTIDVVPGSVANIGVAAPEAPLHVNAVPWADILVDGSPVGQTPLGNLLIPVGPHSVTFRHPELGERTLAVVVTVQGANRVAVDFTR
jgi:archaellum component FlaF (FlaF/FlaG flagellin family)